MKQDYFLKSTEGSRLFQLNPTDLEIAYLGSSTNNDQNAIENLKILYLKKRRKYMSKNEKLVNLNKGG